MARAPCEITGSQSRRSDAELCTEGIVQVGEEMINERRVLSRRLTTSQSKNLKSSDRIKLRHFDFEKIRF